MNTIYINVVKSEVTFNPNYFNNTEIVIINPDAKTQPILYNLDAILSVGYRVNSKQAIHFRRWATSVLKEYIVKCFALDDELEKRLKIWKRLLAFRNSRNSCFKEKIQPKNHRFICNKCGLQS